MPMDDCTLPPERVRAAIAALEAKRDAYVENLIAGAEAVPGAVDALARDLAALRSLLPVAEDSKLTREWRARPGHPSSQKMIPSG